MVDPSMGGDHLTVSANLSSISGIYTSRSAHMWGRVGVGGRVNEVDRALPWLESTAANGDRSTADRSGRTIPRPKGTYTDRGGHSSGEAWLTRLGALPARVSRLSVSAALSARTRLSDLGTLARLRGCASVGPSTKALGRVWVHGEGKIHIADGVILDGRAAPIELHAHPSAVIRVGSGARVEGGASLEAVSGIEIGRGVRLGEYCKILDNHFHSVGRERHRPPPSRPIVVEDGASVGARAILLPGAYIGSGAVVPADVVISRRFGAVTSAGDQPVAGRTGAAAGPAAVRAMPFVPGRSWSGKLRGQIDVLRAAWYLRGCDRGPRVRATGPVRVAPEGSVRIGARTVFVGGMIPSRIECEPGASIEIGSNTVFNYGVTLAASESIRIGSRAMFGSLVRVGDRGTAGSRPVVIGDDVWVAHGATIGPGVTVGSGSVIGAGSVVLSDVPPESLAVGNPARSMSLSLRANDPAPGASQGGVQEVTG